MERLFQVSYVGGATREVSYQYFTDNTYTTSLVSALSYTVPSNFEITDILLRVNVAPLPATNATARSTAINNLQISRNGAGFEDMNRTIGSVTSNSIVASATGGGNGEREFAVWTGALVDGEDFVIRGGVTYTWSGSAIPGGSSLAFQFKFGDELSFIAVPEPHSAGLVLMLGLGGLVAVARRR